jgi:hypothetical protein
MTDDEIQAALDAALAEGPPRGPRKNQSMLSDAQIQNEFDALMRGFRSPDRPNPLQPCLPEQPRQRQKKTTAEIKEENETDEEPLTTTRVTRVKNRVNQKKQKEQLTVIVPACFKTMHENKKESSSTFRYFSTSPRRFHVASDLVFACEGMQYVRRREDDRFFARGMECEVKHKVNFFFQPYYVLKNVDRNFFFRKVGSVGAWVLSASKPKVVHIFTTFIWMLWFTFFFCSDRATYVIVVNAKKAVLQVRPCFVVSAEEPKDPSTAVKICFICLFSCLF